MNIETMLTIENWIENPLETMMAILGNRDLTREYIVLQDLMNKTTKHSDKKWNRTISQYDSIDLIEEIAKLSKPVSILDVGCGDGNVLGLLKEEFGNDLECYGISVMNHPHPKNISYNICPAEIMPFEWGNKFDIVITHQTFRYILFPRLALKECIRVTKKGGVFAGYIGTISEENRILYNSDLFEQLKDIKEIEQNIYNCNFDNIIKESINSNKSHEVITKKEGFPHKIIIYK